MKWRIGWYRLSKIGVDPASLDSLGLPRSGATYVETRASPFLLVVSLDGDIVHWLLAFLVRISLVLTLLYPYFSFHTRSSIGPELCSSPKHNIRSL